MGSVNGVNGTNGVNGHKPSVKFTLKDVPVENLRPLRVVVVGAGFSGICAAIRYVKQERWLSAQATGTSANGCCVNRIPERLRNVDLTVYEKNDGIGGVW